MISGDTPERFLNGLVNDLHVPENLHQRGLRLFDLVDGVGLSALADIPEAGRLDPFRAEFERVSAAGHPLRAALDDLQTVEVVRIIEGRG